ncbi:MAG: hypothetical protein M1826_001938 [Phylliscum demangeonii]|nr:MAG: hypothetical protein M1826_001938 [Phylliscum demangeonii]
MGRQAYLTRLALGRSAYEEPEPPVAPDDPAQLQEHLHYEGGCPSLGLDAGTDYVQHYNQRGHPFNVRATIESRDVIRAQNDVLATIGVCVGSETTERSRHTLAPKQPSYKADDTEVVERLVRENEAGSNFTELSDVCRYLAMWWVGTLRGRLQAYPVLAQAPFSALVFRQWRYLGPSTFLFAGLSAAMVYPVLIWRGMQYMLNPIQKKTLETVAPVENQISLKRFLRGWWLHDAFGPLLRHSYSFSIAAFQVFSLSQQLALVPSRRLFPSLDYFKLLSPKSPLYLPIFPASPQSPRDWALSVLTSPLVLAFALFKIKVLVDKQLISFIRTKIPDPEPLHYTTLWASEFAPWTGGFTIYKNIFMKLPAYLNGAIGYCFCRQPGSTGQAAGNEGAESAASESLPHSTAPVDPAPQTPSRVGDSGPASASTSPGSHPPVRVPFRSPGGAWSTWRGMSQQMARYGAARTAAMSAEERQSLALDEARHASSSTNTNPDAPVPAADPTPHFQLSYLSFYPLHSLRYHLASFLGTIITLPLEAVLMRSLAVSYLRMSSPPGRFARANVTGLLSASGVSATDVLSARFYWPGLYPGRQFIIRVLECLAVELLVRAVVHGVGTKLVQWYGRTFFGWGKERQS